MKTKSDGEVTIGGTLFRGMCLSRKAKNFNIAEFYTIKRIVNLSWKACRKFKFPTKLKWSLKRFERRSGSSGSTWVAHDGHSDPFVFSFYIESGTPSWARDGNNVE